MIVDSVVEDYWYGPANPSDDELWLAALDRCTYAYGEGWKTPAVLNSKSTVAAIRKQLKISYINHAQRTVEA